MLTALKFRKPRDPNHELRNLEPEQLSLLKDLAKIGAATPIQLEIKTHRIGENVRSQLKELEDSGYVDCTTFTGGMENEVFTVSSSGYQQIRKSLDKTSDKTSQVYRDRNQVSCQ